MYYRFNYFCKDTCFFVKDEREKLQFAVVPFQRVFKDIIVNVLIFRFVSYYTIVIIGLPQWVVAIEFRHFDVIFVNPIVNYFHG